MAILYGGMQTATIRTGRDFLISWWQVVYRVCLVGAACCPQVRNKGRLVAVSASLALWVSDLLLAHVKAGWQICLCVRVEEGLGVGYCEMEGLLAQKNE